MSGCVPVRDTRDRRGLPASAESVTAPAPRELLNVPVDVDATGIVTAPVDLHE
jgi:hypothetical protein